MTDLGDEIMNKNFYDMDSVDYANLYGRFFIDGWIPPKKKTFVNLTEAKKEEAAAKKKETAKTTNDANASVDDFKDSGLPDDVQKELAEQAKKDPKNASKFIKVAKFIGNMLNSASSATIASMLDNFTLGNMKEAICDIYKKKKLDSMSEDDVNTVGQELHKMPEFEKAKKQYVDSGKRTDDNTSTDIDDSSCKYSCLWYSKKKDQNVLYILNTLVTDIQKKADEQQKQIAELKFKVKSMKIDGVGDEEVEAFGPIIAGMVKDNKSAKDIAARVKKLKEGVKESVQHKMHKYKHKMLSEGRIPVVTNARRKHMELKAICESKEFQMYVVKQLLNEGLMDKFKSLGTAVKNVSNKFTAKIKDASSKALDALKNGGLAPILKIAGIGLLAVTGAWGVAMIIATMMLIEKHGKQLKYAFDYMWSSFANSKGVISQMDFSIKDKPDIKYSARFYVKDLTWRVVNASNQNKHPSKDFAKSILTGDVGKKFIDRIVNLWDPVFSPDKGGKIDFAELLKQSKELNISDKQLAMLNDFRNQYTEIKTNVTKPQIDTRTQEL